MKKKKTVGNTFTIMCKEEEEKNLKIAMVVEIAQSGQYLGMSDFVWHAVAARLGKTYHGVDYSKTKKELIKTHMEINKI